MTIYNANNVVVLYVPGERRSLTEENWKIVEKAHAAAQKAIEDAAGDPKAMAKVQEDHYLIGESVVIDNPDGDRGPYTLTSVGASDLKEALQEVIGGFDLAHIGEDGISSDDTFVPEYVASTHEQLAELLADYYDCSTRKLNEVLV